MKRVGVRELKDTVARQLGRVSAGELVILTDRDEDVAVLGPASGPPNTALAARLLSHGTIAWREGKPPLPAKRIVIRGRPLSETLVEDRGD